MGCLKEWDCLYSQIYDNIEGEISAPKYHLIVLFF